MPFQVMEQGRRIETPWRSLFPARQVNSLQETAKSRSVSDLDEGRQSEGQNKFDGSSRGPFSENSHIASYSASDSPQRRSVYRADQLMSSPVFTLPLTATLDLALREFQQRHIRHIPVIDRSQSLIGLLSERDLLAVTSSIPEVRRAAGVASLLQRAQPLTATVGEVMHHRVLTATADTNLRELTKVMLEHRVGSMPIVTSEGMLQGMITRSDILQAVSHQVALELWA